MSPEQREHPTEVDNRADIYALGMVFYQMLTGELPGKKIEPPSSKVHIDVRLDEVVLRALEKKPELRYQQVSEVKTIVDEIAASSPGGKQREETKGAKPHQDWMTWSPLQSPEVGEICSHFTKAERNHLSLLGLLVSVWIVGTCFGLPALVRSNSGSGKWIVALIWVILFVVSIQMGHRMMRYFLCSTMWAKEHGFVPERLRLFSFSRANLWKVGAVLLVGLGLAFFQNKALTSYLGLVRAGPRYEVHYRVFEIENAEADKLVPVAQRENGATGNWQVADINPETLVALVDGRVQNKHVMIDRHLLVPLSQSPTTIVQTRKPGVKEDQQQVVVGWPIVSDFYGHSLLNYVSNDIVNVSGHGFFGVRSKDGVLQLKIERVLTHKIGDRPAVDVHVAYEGNAPQKGALAFFVPFAKKDDATGYFLFTVEVNRVAANP